MISYGWIFIALLMAAVSSYVMLGMLALIVVERKCDYPHRKQWAAFFEDVSLGRRWLWAHVKRAGGNSHVLHPE